MFHLSYWIYSSEDVADDMKKKTCEIKPSIIVAKYVKRKDLVFALLNLEIVEAL